jgi:site-specific DNA-methyltransferase (adenine-specific)
VTFRKEIIGPHELWLGDCADVVPRLTKGLGFDAIITDPPYAIPTLVASGRDSTRSVGDLSIAETAFRLFFDQWSSVLALSGRIFVFCDGASYPVMFRAAFNTMNSALLIWDKGQIGMGREFRKSHELILHAWRKGTPIFADGVGRADILKFAPVASEARTHPAEKPISLMTELIRPSGDVIVDPFMGSGSTGVACAKLGRKFIGVEIEPKYFDIACHRIEEATKQADLFIEPPAPKAEQIAFVMEETA